MSITAAIALVLVTAIIGLTVVLSIAIIKDRIHRP